MSLENRLTNCPLCKCTLNDSVNRLIKEFCGHLKCRACLLKENNGCQLCYELKEKHDGDGGESTNEIRTLPEDHNIVYYATENCDASDYGESGSDKLQIDTDSESSQDNITSNLNDLSSKTKNNLAISKKYTNKCKKDKISRRSKSLYSHILTKSKNDGTYFECSICTKTFTSRGHRHYHLFCGNVDKPLKCDICGKQFITRFHYNYHIETHQKNPKFNCSKCNRSYLSTNSLRKHSQKHSTEWKHFVCSECGARFQSSSLLKLHENTHKNIYPFECDKCDRKFTSKSNLQNHLVVHINEKKFACDLCGKKFARKGALKLHSSSHSDVRPYECKHCNKTFTHQRIYSRHLTIHLGNKIFNCPFCDAKCSRKDNFYRHLRNLHPNSNYKELVLSNCNIKSVSNTKDADTLNEILEEVTINKEIFQSNCTIKRVSNTKQEDIHNKILEEDTLEESSQAVDIKNTNAKQIESLVNVNNKPNKNLSDGPNSVNVIQSVGNVKPISFLNIDSENKLPRLSPTRLPEYRSEIAKEICQIANEINCTPMKRSINTTKQKKPYDPIEIYRKILMPNELDEEDDEHKISNINENTFNHINQKEQDITKDILQKPPPIDFSEIHWRKRTSQYFAMN